VHWGLVGILAGLKLCSHTMVEQYTTDGKPTEGAGGARRQAGGTKESGRSKREFGADLNLGRAQQRKEECVETLRSGEYAEVLK